MNYHINIERTGGKFKVWVGTGYGSDSTEIVGTLDDVYAWIKKTLAQLEKEGKANYPTGSED